jgi:hypothetical protein
MVNGLMVQLQMELGQWMPFQEANNLSMPTPGGGRALLKGGARLAASNDCPIEPYPNKFQRAQGQDLQPIVGNWSPSGPSRGDSSARAAKGGDMPKLLKDMAAEEPDLIPEQLEHLRTQEIGQNWAQDSARVAALAQVPEKARDRFWDAVFGAICDAWQEADVREATSDIQQDRTLFPAVDALRTAKRALADLDEDRRKGVLAWPISEIERGIDRFLEAVLGGTGQSRPAGESIAAVGVRGRWRIQYLRSSLNAC